MKKLVKERKEKEIIKRAEEKENLKQGKLESLTKVLLKEILDEWEIPYPQWWQMLDLISMLQLQMIQTCYTNFYSFEFLES